MNDTPMRIVVAEDEPIASMALRAQLEALDCEVLAVARNGEEAANLGRCMPADVAIFDHRMPLRTGLDAARDVYRHAPTPVLLLTGVTAADLPDPVPEPPVFATLTKPVGLVDLRAGLERVRDAFAARLADDPHLADAVRRSRDERTLIARAVHRSATGGDLAAAAARLIRSADEQQRTLAETARDLLDTAPTP